VVYLKSGRLARAREEWERCLLENKDDVRARSYIDMLEREEEAADDPRGQ